MKENNQWLDTLKSTRKQKIDNAMVILVSKQLKDVPYRCEALVVIKLLQSIGKDIEQIESSPYL